MKKIVLVRYGEYDENDHLNDFGKNQMISVSEKLKPIIENKNVCIICAQIPRAIESSQIIAQELKIKEVKSFLELYAEPEKNIFVDIDRVMKLISSIFEKFEIIIAVSSKEYIEEIQKNLLENSTIEKTNLQRGEIIILNYTKKV